MRISDWSSDVCSSDLKAVRRKIVADRTSGASWVVTDGLKPGERVITQGIGNLRQGAAIRTVPESSPQRVGTPKGDGAGEIGRASCRERVCPCGTISVVDESCTKKNRIGVAPTVSTTRTGTYR